MRNSWSSCLLLALTIGATACSVGRGVPHYVAHESRIIEVTSAIAEDSAMLALIAPYQAELGGKMGAVIGHNSAMLDVKSPESGLPPFVLLMMKSETEALFSEKIDAAWINLGGLRSTLYEGDVTVGDIYRIFPFENQVTILEMKGSDVRLIANEVATRKRLALGEIADLQDEQIYRIATIDYLADGNDRTGAVSRAVSRRDTDLLLRDLILSYYKRQGQTH